MRLMIQQKSSVVPYFVWPFVRLGTPCEIVLEGWSPKPHYVGMCIPIKQ